ncbi:hypothetical protein [Agathobacter ruminis]|uniref:Uncharacterized protein n=1 Tax=Agathobacter ruminis TaxID=1712665 RepID=A0A2G3E0R6_9FIRM|nr:hypothetical protein [Agathobacter ruminis]MDC7300547.1 hypothetical protein [Agathobacter ruminis]PHU36887.1 hypothetical protein CSX02_10800 [Agathobacter ruminis]
MSKKRIIIVSIIAAVLLACVCVFFIFKNRDKEYFKVTFHKDVYPAYEWDIVRQSDDMTSLIAKPEQSPEVGEYLLLQDELGDQTACRIESVDTRGDGSYVYELTKVNDLSEIMDEMSFSGKADFGVYGVESKSAKNNSNESIFAGKTKVYAADNNSSAKKSGPIDLTIALSYSIDDAGKGSFKTDVKMNGLSMSASKEDRESDEKSSEKQNTSDDEHMKSQDADVDSLSTSGTCTIEGSVTLEDLEISADGEVNFLDIKKNRAHVKVTSNEVLNLKCEGEIEGELPLAEIVVPIPVTMGAVSVVIEPYLYFDADGTVELEYRINNTRLEMNMDVGKKKLDFSKSDKGKVQEPVIKASVSLEGGIGVSGDLQILKCGLVKPYCNLGINVGAETLPVIKGWNNVAPCVDAGIALPVLTVGCDFLPDSKGMFAKVIKEATGWELHIEKELISKEKAPVQKSIHIETDEEDGSLKVVDKCTHEEREEVRNVNPLYTWISGVNDKKPLDYMDQGDYYELVTELMEVDYVPMKDASKYTEDGKYEVWEIDEGCYSYNGIDGFGALVNANSFCVEYRGIDEESSSIKMRKDAKVYKREYINNKNEFVLQGTLQELIETNKMDEFNEPARDIGACGYFIQYDKDGYVNKIIVDEGWAMGAHVYDF